MSYPASTLSRREKLVAAAVVLGSVFIYCASNPQFLFAQLTERTAVPYYERLHVTADTPWAWLTASDYSFQLANALLDGHLGLTTQPPSWLNEMIPLRGKFYAVFPLGSVLTMLPFALLHRVVAFPVAGVIVALAAGLAAFALLRLSLGYRANLRRAVFLTSSIMFGSWFWTNTIMGGAWQFTLAFAPIGELAALYFLLIKRQPFVAGCFFSLALGNRTEVIVTAPVFLYLVARAQTILRSALRPRPRHPLL